MRVWVRLRCSTCRRRLFWPISAICNAALELCDELYRGVRRALATRMTFFGDIRTLTRYMYFENWRALLVFMATQLELGSDTS